MPWCAGSGDSSGGMRSSPAAPESLTSRSPARKQQPPAAPSVRPPRAAANGVTALLLQQRIAAEDFAGEGRSGARKGKLQAAHVKQLRPKGAVQSAAVAATTVSADMSPGCTLWCTRLHPGCQERNVPSGWFAAALSVSNRLRQRSSSDGAHTSRWCRNHTGGAVLQHHHTAFK